jgi:fatty acid desaturase
LSAAKIPAATLRALAVRSDAKGLAQWLAHLALLAATGALVWQTRGTWWIVPAIVLHGFVLDFLFCALHEATHFTPFRSRWLNHALGHSCGFLLLLPFGYFRLFHWDHHRFTQDPTRDPELGRAKPRNWPEYLWHVSGLQNWLVRIKMVLTHALTGRVAQPWVPASARAGVVREARAYLAGYAALALGAWWIGSDALLWVWVLPAMAGQVFLRHYLLAEHTGCATNDDTYANTRTTLTNPLVRLVAWNMPYHVEHHAYPAVPFHALPRLHPLIAPRIATLTAGYWRAACEIRAHLFGVRR